MTPTELAERLTEDAQTWSERRLLLLVRDNLPEIVAALRAQEGRDATVAWLCKRTGDPTSSSNPWVELDPEIAEKRIRSGRYAVTPLYAAPREGQGEKKMEPTRAMIDRFLSWRLPDDFAPDCYVTFDRDRAKANNGWPIGTNLLTAEQALAMLAYVLSVPRESQGPEPVANQCDGCRRGLRIKDGNHIEDYANGFRPVMACTAHLYEQAAREAQDQRASTPANGTSGPSQEGAAGSDAHPERCYEVDCPHHPEQWAEVASATREDAGTAATNAPATHTADLTASTSAHLIERLREQAHILGETDIQYDDPIYSAAFRSMNESADRIATLERELAEARAVPRATIEVVCPRCDARFETRDYD